MEKIEYVYRGQSLACIDGPGAPDYFPRVMISAESSSASSALWVEIKSSLPAEYSLIN